MRIYLAATLPLLAGWYERGRIGPAPLRAFAVTPRLRESDPDGDAEELEFAATQEAARESLRLLAPGDREPRRVVIAVDVADNAVRPDPDPDSDPDRDPDPGPGPGSGPATAHIDGEVDWDRIAAVLVDEAGAAGAVEEALGYDLLWYARQEVPDLLDARSR